MGTRCTWNPAQRTKAVCDRRSNHLNATDVRWWKKPKERCKCKLMSDDLHIAYCILYASSSRSKKDQQKKPNAATKQQVNLLPKYSQDMWSLLGLLCFLFFI